MLKEQESREQRSRLTGLLLKVLSGLLLAGALAFMAVPVLAADYRSVYCYQNVSASLRTVDGALFTISYNSSNHTYTLKVKKNGSETVAAKGLDSAEIYTNGRTVFYTIGKDGAIGIRKKNLSTGKVTKIRNLTSSGTISFQWRHVYGKYAYFTISSSGKVVLRKLNLSTGKVAKMGTLVKSSSWAGAYLAGIYKGQMYYIATVNGPEGDFKRISLSTKKVKKINIGDWVVSESSCEGSGRFLLTDGTGAGMSQLGLYEAAKGKFTVVTKKPVAFTATSKNIYYAANISDTLSVMGNFTVAVRKYNFSTGKTTTLVNSLFIGQNIEMITSTYLTYYDASGKLHKKKW